MTNDMGAGTEVYIAGAQTDELRDAQTRLYGEKQHGAVTPPNPGRAIGRRQESIDLWFRQEVNQCPLEALCLDRQDAPDVGGVLRVT